MPSEIRSYDAVAVQRLLAHRHPFLLVDKIDVVEAGRRVIGIKRLTAGEWWSSPTPATPIAFPLVVEALAQTGAALLIDLVDTASVAAQGHFDVIFCRNVLIYFDDSSRLLAVNNLFDSLHPGGYICLGHTESMTRISKRFDLRRFEDAIVYQRPGRNRDG